MRADRFDHIARWAGAQRGTRRSLLHALGLGGATLALAPGLASAVPVAGERAVGSRGQAAPADPIDDLAFQLEYDVERIFAFVRDEVVYDPYPGMLRGAKGTLWGLAGNSADQSLLLAALLDAALIQTRLVVGELDEAAAADLLDAGRLDGNAASARFERLMVPPADSAAAPPALTPEQQAIVDAFPALVTEVQGRIDRHLEAGVATVTQGLTRAGVDLPSPEATLPEDERRRHVWVQYAVGPEWVDLDPSIPRAAPGDAFATNPTTPDALPDDMVHRVTFRLIAEQVTGGGVTETELLVHEAPSADLLGVPISLIHPQPEALETIGVGVAGLLQGFRNFVPSLLVGEETVFGAPVTFATGGGVVDVFDGGAVDGDTLAEWLEVTVTTPSGARTARRTVFDRVGAEARAASDIDLAAVAPVEFVDAGDPEGSFLPLAGLWALGVVAGVVPERLAAATVPEEVRVEDLLPALHAYHYAREVESARQVVLAGVRLYLPEPNVTAFVQRPTAVATDGSSAEIAIDLLHRAVAVAPGGALGEVHPLLAAGVLSHAVEQVMLEAGGLDPLRLPITATSGVSRVFVEAAAQGVATVVLLPDGSTVIPALAAGPRGLIEAALAAGRIVIVPERPVELDGRQRTGWWIVDPATGATWDSMDDGGGSTISEYAFIAVKIALCAVMFAGLGAAFGGVARGVAGLIQGNDGATLEGGVGALGGSVLGGLGAVGCAG